ncbi:hypothetical protein [Amycolatopsis sp. lyj-109]|uniref:hypothetical protein n=1 Tax=Amycolatopsis sp. lyj-109 TaxID=2789287 RepID=UPI00397C8461
MRGYGQAVRGDARQLETLLPAECVGEIAVVTPSPSPSGHGLVKTDQETEDGKVRKHHYPYGIALDRGDLAYIGHHLYLARTHAAAVTWRLSPPALDGDNSVSRRTWCCVVRVLPRPRGWTARGGADG